MRANGDTSILIKLLTSDTIWVKNGLDIINEVKCADGFTVNTKLKCVCLNINYYFVDYGNTWAFTREELE